MAASKKKGSVLGSAAWAAVIVAAVAVSHQVREEKKRVPVAERPVSVECMEELSTPKGASAFDEAVRVLRFSLQPADANDVAVDALLRVCTREPAGSLRDLYFGAINKMRANPFRRTLRDAQKQARYAQEQLACPTDTLNPLDAIASNETQALVARWLNDLSAEDIELLNKHVFEGFSFRDIEEQTGVPRSSLSDRWKKIRERLRAHTTMCSYMKNPELLLEELKRNLDRAR